MSNQQHHPWMMGRAIGLLIVAWISLGMGGFGDTDTVTKIPIPERSFLVELVDAEDVSFVLRNFSMDGLTMFPVTAGRANISLDFAEIEEAWMYLRDDQVVAQVTFRNRSSGEFIVDPRLPFYGLTDWGKMKIKSGNIRYIRFLGRTDAQNLSNMERE